MPGRLRMRGFDMYMPCRPESSDFLVPYSFEVNKSRRRRGSVGAQWGQLERHFKMTVAVVVDEAKRQLVLAAGCT